MNFVKTMIASDIERNGDKSLKTKKKQNINYLKVYLPLGALILISYFCLIASSYAQEHVENEKPKQEETTKQEDTNTDSNKRSHLSIIKSIDADSVALISNAKTKLVALRLTEGKNVKKKMILLVVDQDGKHVIARLRLMKFVKKKTYAYARILKIAKGLSFKDLLNKKVYRKMDLSIARKDISSKSIPGKKRLSKPIETKSEVTAQETVDPKAPQEATLFGPLSSQNEYVSIGFLTRSFSFLAIDYLLGTEIEPVVSSQSFYVKGFLPKISGMTWMNWFGLAIVSESYDPVSINIARQGDTSAQKATIEGSYFATTLLFRPKFNNILTAAGLDLTLLSNRKESIELTSSNEILNSQFDVTTSGMEGHLGLHVAPIRYIEVSLKTSLPLDQSFEAQDNNSSDGKITGTKSTFDLGLNLKAFLPLSFIAPGWYAEFLAGFAQRQEKISSSSAGVSKSTKSLDSDVYHAGLGVRWNP